MAEQLRKQQSGHPLINPAFKMVFLASSGGILLFIAICTVITIAAGGEMSDPPTKLVTGLFDLAKIGFGAIVRLLTAHTLK
ncbi:MAG: hypothetical protein ACREC6_03185 [Hyphomicrobiaceae bacterium]